MRATAITQTDQLLSSQTVQLFRNNCALTVSSAQTITAVQTQHVHLYQDIRFIFIWRYRSPSYKLLKLKQLKPAMKTYTTKSHTDKADTISFLISLPRHRGWCRWPHSQMLQRCMPVVWRRAPVHSRAWREATYSHPPWQQCFVSAGDGVWRREDTCCACLWNRTHTQILKKFGIIKIFKCVWTMSLKQNTLKK